MLKTYDTGRCNVITDFINDFLKKVPVFNNLSDDIIDDIKKHLYKKIFKKNSMIYYEGDAVNRLYILEMGKIEIYKRDPEGKKLTLWFIHPGELFCLPTMLYELAIANAEAVQDSILYCLDRADYENLVAKHPQISAGMLMCLAGRIINYSESLNRSAFAGAKSRIAEVILKHLITDDKGFLICQLSRSELSSLTGICRETVSRTIKQFKENNILDVKHRKILIKDIEKLKSNCLNQLCRGRGQDCPPPLLHS